MSEVLDYSSAKRKLCEFLERRSLSPSVAWVFAEDIAWVEGGLKVRSPLPAENENAVRTAIESEVARELGVELRAVGKTAEKTFCAVVLPTDERQAREMMINGLKISVPDRLVVASQVSGLIGWAFVRLRQRAPSPFADLLRRKS